MEVVDFFKLELVYFSCVVLQFNDNSAYPLVFPKSSDYVNFRGVPWAKGYVLNVEVSVGINVFGAPLMTDCLPCGHIKGG